MEHKSLFSKGKSNNLGKMLGRWKVKKQGNSMGIQIYDNGLLEINSLDSTCRTINFDFDLIFGFTKSPIEVKLQRNKEYCIYTLIGESHLQQWRDILKNKINQRGFHQQFKPIKKIGKGNFAAVYLAQKYEDNMNYAVKAFSKQSAYSEQNGKQCLIKQIQVMRCLNHKNTMKCYEVFQSQNSLYIIFELLSGGQLYDKIKSKYRFKLQQTKVIMYGILRGLRQMHSKGIMHRDLKPENLLFRRDGQWDCIIADFGLAEFANIQQYLFVRCGTPGYVAPEVINIKDMKTKYSTICDLYSLGLIFHVLLLGKSAFPGTTYNQVLAQNRAANIQLSGQEYRKLQPETLDLLSKLLKKKPTQRISAEQALAHQFFKGIQNEIEIETETEQINTTIDSTSIPQSTEYGECNSPLLTTANPKRRFDKSMKKDSCVELHVGRDNVLTGKTEEVDSMKTNKVSIVNTSTSVRKPKVSQFCVHNR